MISAELLRRLDVAVPRYTSYPTVPAWSETFGPADHARALAAAGTRAEAPLSLYVHIPFCQELCNYCGCNVVITRDQRRVERYLDALALEARLVAEQLGARRTVSRVHFGGGTPTFLEERQLAALWRALTASFRVADGAELAVEINPVVTRASQLELLGSLGFNRLSIGVQDFDPAVQAAIARVQTVDETRAMMELARRIGFGSINLDLIYGLPRQTVASFRRTVQQVAALGPDRVAVFSFAYVPSLRPHQKRLPVAEIPTGMAKLELFQTAREELCGAGYRAIGMDHFARPDDELAMAAERGLVGRDFQGYTVSRAPDTVALGATAISQLGRAYAQNEKSLGVYEAHIAAGRLATERGIWISEDDWERGAIIESLMCNFQADLGLDGPLRYADELARLRQPETDGLVRIDGRHITVTPLGRLFVRNVAMVFDAHLLTGQLRASRAV
jgi:oxygen-independent coproporphyrinogen-3 oxidase